MKHKQDKNILKETALAQQNNKGKWLNTILLIAFIGFFVFYGYKVFTLGFNTDVFDVSGAADLYRDLNWIGLFVSFAGSIAAYVSRAKGSSFLRGITIGTVIGIVILTLVIAAVKP